jgi:hypothetical protein
MKRKTIMGLIATVAIATAVAFSGCINDNGEKPVESNCNSGSIFRMH